MESRKQRNVGARSHWLSTTLMFLLAFFAAGALFYVAMLNAPKVGFSIPGFVSNAPAAASKSVPMEGDNLQAVVEAVFGTIQFALSVLSGIIIVVAAIVTFIVGRSASETQASAREQVEKLAEVYEDKFVSAVNGEIKKQIEIDDVRDLLGRYKHTLEGLAEEHKRVKPLIDDYIAFERAYEGAEPDYAASFLKFGEDDDRGQVDEDKRRQYQQALQRVQEGALRRKVSGNLVFNAAQTAARLQMTAISHQLAALASWLDPSAEHQLRVRRSEIESGQRYSVEEQQGEFTLVSNNRDNDPNIANRIRQEAVDVVFHWIGRIPYFQAELVIAEIWNVSVQARALDRLKRELKKAILEAEAAGRPLPSYAYAVCVQAHLREGLPGWQPEVRDLVDRAIAVIEQEASMSTWYPHTMRELPRHLIQMGWLDDARQVLEIGVKYLNIRNDPQVQMLISLVSQE